MDTLRHANNSKRVTGNVTHITVNAARTISPLPHDWRFFGYDECNYTYMPEGRRMLERFGKLGDTPYYVRTHNGSRRVSRSILPASNTSASKPRMPWNR